MHTCRPCCGSMWRCDGAVVRARGAAMLAAAALPLAVQAGCGGLVPASWLAADAQFVEALPDEARTRVGAPPAAATREAGDPAVSMAVMEPVVSTLNELTLQSVRIVEEIVAVPPDHYEEDRRAWGPAYSDDYDVTYELDVTRGDGDRFDYTLTGQVGVVEAPDVPVMSGRYARDGDGLGRGRFTLDLGAVSEVFDVDLGFRDSVEVVHQIGDGVFAVGMDLQGLTVVDGGHPVVLDEQYAYRSDDLGGLLCFAGRYDVDAGGVEEVVHAFAAWTDGGGGRAEGTLAGGDLGQDSTAFVECWDASGATTYWSDSLGLLPETGDADLCPDSLPAAPEHCSDLYPDAP